MFISEKKVEVRYAETDQMGVVHHSNYLVWMELGRTALIQELGFTYAGLEADGYLAPVINVSIQYKSAMKYGQTATVRTWIESHKRLRTVYGYEILHEDGTVATTATSEHVLVTKEEFKPVLLSKVNPEWDAVYTKEQRVTS
ncbi:thioesterase family protein [Sporosarcina sp. HYO08]|uniref:acyl-CoA thioesterase n=1 Tax=Sporosarcina sp. HYO08 TaxID=1759557 RepID=UPI00079B8734|nr:thioesterase family protein [Sporosarcina sp. HYO08]KXH81716.1 hypothetical protein AU377_05470 [Sporosarcina sp. HYO08]